MNPGSGLAHLSGAWAGVLHAGVLPVVAVLPLPPCPHWALPWSSPTVQLTLAMVLLSLQMDHDPRNPAYIATQGPLPATVADFWQVSLL